MTTTLGNALADLRIRLNEPTVAHWTDPQLRKWIVEATKDVSRKTETLQTRTLVAFTAGLQEAALPSNMLRVNRLEWMPSGSGQVYPLEMRDFNTMDEVWWTGQTQSSGTPSFATFWGFPPALKLVLYPKPAVAGNVNVFHYRLAASLATDGTADGSTLEVPDGWEDAVLEYASYLALRQDRDPRWQEAKGAYDEMISSMMDRTRRWHDQGGQISHSGSMVPSWLYS